MTKCFFKAIALLAVAMSMICGISGITPVASGAASGAAAKPAAASGAGGANANGGGKPDAAQYQGAADAVAAAIGKSTEQTKELLSTLMASVKNDPGQLITKDMLQKLVQEHAFLPQKAGTRSVSLQADQGFNGFSNYQPSGWVMTETVSGPADKVQQTTDEKVPVYTYPKGVGPVLINSCTAQNYTANSPCYSSRQPGQGKMICPNLMDAAAYVGVGFDGRGFYKIESRRASLVQRSCANLASFMGKDVPDTMNVFGIFETTAETKSFQSADEYLSYIREKAGLSDQKNLFLSEASKYSSSSGFGMNLGAIGAIAGGAIGAAVAGPGGAMLGATLGGAVGGAISGGKASGSGSQSAQDQGKSSSLVTQTDKANVQQGASNSFFAIMYVNIILYEITLDDVRPQDINLAALRDYMSLPESYYSVGADVKYQNFLLRWGTHYIRSGKFGGQLKITKTAKAERIKSAQEFASIAETEFQSMFASLQSKYSQESSSWGFLGFGGESHSASQNDKAKSEAKYKSTLDQQSKLSQSFRQSEFTQTTVEAQGGTPEIAEALVDFYTPAFKQLYHKWIVSIKDYVKPFEFQLKSIDQLFNMNMDDLFPSGNLDFGCMGSAGSTVKILVEPETKRRYYLDARTTFAENKTTTTMVKTYCRYSSLEDFKTDLERRRISLEKAVAVYMAEGPFPTSSYELDGGQPGCEQATLGALNLLSSGVKPLTYTQLSRSPFLIAFNLPQEVPNLIKPNAKYVMLYRADRWFATEPGNQHIQLYDGCELTGYKPADTKVCFLNIILTYEEKSGFFHIDPSDFVASKRRNPTLPDWLSGSTVARAARYDISGDSTSVAGTVPCNVKWLNSHRLDPGKEENCLHFTAASAGDIFVTFASIPKDHSTWYYLQINMEGVAFYKAMQLQKKDYQKGMGTLGDKNLYQSYFVCINQAKGEVLMQFGKADSNSDVGTVYSGYKFAQDSQYSRLSFYTFGAGSKPVSLMDIRLTKQMPKVECLNTNYILKDGHCVLDCHKECIDCNLAKDDKACFKCRNVRIETRNTAGSDRSKIAQCLPVCPKGHELSDTAEKLCVPCSAGQFKSAVGNEKCSPCAPGSFSAAGAVECTACSPGTFSATPGSTECQKCAAGTAANTKGSTVCTKCRPGFFSPLGQPECSPCATGQFSAIEGQASCRMCSVGFFAATPGLTACTACPAGTSSSEGSMSCDNNCKKGEFSPSKGIECRKCSAGTFSASAGSNSCTPCPAGTYQSNEGQESCLPAPAGSYATGPGARISTPCPAGSANAATGKSSASDCVPCTAGKYSNIAGSTVCSSCPRGSYQPQANQKNCLFANPGKYVDSEGQEVQKSCPPGKVSGVGASDCTACNAGSFANQIGSATCSQCPAGSWSGAGASACTECAAGKFSSAGATSCTQCAAGSFSVKVGSSTCVSCPAGTWSNSGSDRCTSCSTGSFSASGASVCTPCPAGRYADSAGSSACKVCSAGSASGSGARDCTHCQPGTYSSGSGSATCAACPAGHFSHAGASSCTPCHPGSFASNSGSRQCSQCAAGTYSNTARATGCQQCDLTFALARYAGWSQCEWCPGNGVTRDRNSCYRKVNPSSCLPPPFCQNAIDNNRNTYGEIQRFMLFRFDFSPPIRLRKIVIWSRVDCCPERSRNLMFVVGVVGTNQGRNCITDDSNFGVYRTLDCAHDNVYIIYVQQLRDQYLSVGDIGFYAE